MYNDLILLYVHNVLYKKYRIFHQSSLARGSHNFDKLHICILQMGFDIYHAILLIINSFNVTFAKKRRKLIPISQRGSILPPIINPPLDPRMYNLILQSSCEFATPVINCFNYNLDIYEP
jgi:hypothetical protein